MSKQEPSLRYDRLRPRQPCRSPEVAAEVGVAEVAEEGTQGTHRGRRHLHPPRLLLLPHRRHRAHLADRSSRAVARSPRIRRRASPTGRPAPRRRAPARTAHSRERTPMHHVLSEARLPVRGPAPPSHTARASPPTRPRAFLSGRPAPRRRACAATAHFPAHTLPLPALSAVPPRARSTVRRSHTARRYPRTSRPPSLSDKPAPRKRAPAPTARSPAHTLPLPALSAPPPRAPGQAQALGTVWRCLRTRVRVCRSGRT